MTKLKPRINCPVCGKEWLWIEDYEYTATSLDIKKIPECRSQNKMIQHWDEWYKLYPKKGSDREDSKRAFKSNIKNEKDLEKLMKGTELYINQCASEGIEKKFRKGAATFIRKKAYISLIKDDEENKKLDKSGDICDTSVSIEKIGYKCCRCKKEMFDESEFITVDMENYCIDCSLEI